MSHKSRITNHKRLKINTLKILISSFILAVILAIGCTEPPVPTLNAKERKLVDSLFKDSINYLKPVLDSICETTFDGRVKAAADSMMAVRMTEVRKQLERIRKLKLRE